MMQDVHHETLSGLVFKKILLDRPTVLAIFVNDCCMTVDEVKMIEKMIVPSDDKITKVKNCYFHNNRQ